MPQPPIGTPISMNEAKSYWAAQTKIKHRRHDPVTDGAYRPIWKTPRYRTYDSKPQPGSPTMPLIESVLAMYPKLSMQGFNYQHRGDWLFPQTPPDWRDISFTLSFFEWCTPKLVNGMNSYSLKHVVGRWGNYIDPFPNGAVIAALLLLDIPTAIHHQNLVVTRQIDLRSHGSHARSHSGNVGLHVPLRTV